MIEFLFSKVSILFEKKFQFLIFRSNLLKGKSILEKVMFPSFAVKFYYIAQFCMTYCV